MISNHLFPNQTHGVISSIPLSNNSTNFDSLYGFFYNGYAVLDPRGICPEGWRIPYKSDWEQLVEYLGGEVVAGGKLKEDTIWKSPNTGADNSSGFKALPGGSLGGSGNYYGFLERVAYWAIDDQFPTSNLHRIILYFDKKSLDIFPASYFPPASGYFCRCIRE